MRPSTTAASVGVGCLLLAWLASAVGMSRAPQPPPRLAQPSEGVQLEELRADVQAQSSRLRKRMAAAPAPRPPDRNPFAFASRDRSRSRPVEVMPAEPAFAAPAEPVVAEAILVLIGVAERKTGDRMVRTAILAGAADDLYLVTEGEEVAGGYRVRTVGAEVVELELIATGEIRRLHLK